MEMLYNRKRLIAEDKATKKQAFALLAGHYAARMWGQSASGHVSNSPSPGSVPRQPVVLS
jgi:hypothetical protein